MLEHTEISGIKSWSVEDRPREKLQLKGKNSLSDAELIAILIGSGSHDVTAVELSRKILGSVENNLSELGKLNIADLCKFKGIGEAKAITILAALELGRRRKDTDILIRIKINSSKDVFTLFCGLIADSVYEEFWILLLNRANKVISKHKISSGGISGTVVDPKVIFKIALENLASSIILCHNHPSGNLKPSNADIELTDKIKKAGDLLDIQVLDHLIISNEGFFSFKDDGIF